MIYFYRMKRAGIYKITSPYNKVYIGQSWDLFKRQNKYKKLSCKGQIKLYASLLKYGYELHSFEVIHELPQDCTQDILDEYETLYWQLYKDCGVEMLNCKVPGKRGYGKHDERTKQKMAKSKAKCITQYSKQGEFIKTWNSILEAANTLNLSKSAISSSCKERTKTSGGFIWKYETYDFFIDPKPFLSRKARKYVPRKGIRLHRPITQYDLEGNFIKEWKNATIAAEDLGLNRRAINECIKGKTKSSGGFKWKRNCQPNSIK